ncbi:hypothetical protein TSAR_007959, partial [Trichomalopsis sarcophagae]
VRMSWITYDEKVARETHEQLNVTGITENAVFPKEKETGNYRPKTLVDETLEYIDPTPNIYTLFVQFNEKFFWNVLLPVQVKWSPRMTSCAGVCSFHPRNRECVISLSTPLLKLRPRKDLIETLLHEMIHAYLFLTNNNRDRDGHGPVFQSHMKRINQEAGTNITIYHSFHEEVRLYQQHWWRCNGPCQKRAPYFGTVRRAMNRAPGPSDFWWKEHQLTCGGQFIKVKEPEKPEKIKKKGDAKGRTSTSTVTKPSENNSLTNWVIKTDSNKDKNIPNKPNQPPKANGNNIKKPNTQPQGTGLSKPVPKPTSTKSNSVSNFQTDLTKLGNSTNNVHGWGTGGPSGSSNKPSHKPQVKGWNNTKSNSTSNVQTDMKKLGNSTNNVHGWGTGGPDGSSSNSSSGNRNSTNNSNSSLSFSGTLGGAGTGRSILLDKFSNTSATNNTQKTSSLNRTNKTQKTNSLNRSNSTTSTNSSFSVETASVLTKTVLCPICIKSVDELKINEHLDTCLDSPQEPEVISDSSHKKRKSEDHYSTSNKKLKDESQQTSSETIDCPMCSKKLLPINFNDHLQKCLSSDMLEEDDDVVSLHDSSSSSINLHDSPHRCLICDKKLEPGMSLNEHLEECVASVFNESNNDDFEEKDSSTGDKSIKTEKEVLERYPCPICMSLIEESLMNDHVDVCLAKSK